MDNQIQSSNAEASPSNSPTSQPVIPQSGSQSLSSGTAPSPEANPQTPRTQSSQAKIPATDENPIIFYCKDCEEVVETNRFGGKYVYKCRKCGTKNVAFGTKKSIYGFFKLEDKEKAKLKEAKRQEKERAAGERAEGSKVIRPASII